MFIREATEARKILEKKGGDDVDDSDANTVLEPSPSNVKVRKHFRPSTGIPPSNGSGKKTRQKLTHLRVTAKFLIRSFKFRKLHFCVYLPRFSDKSEKIVQKYEEMGSESRGSGLSVIHCTSNSSMVWLENNAFIDCCLPDDHMSLEEVSEER